jgi:hypothetical protein
VPARPEAGPSHARATDAPRVLVIGCGALARELLALTRDLPGVKVICVDAALHMRPERIAGAVATRIARARRDYGPDLRIFVAYADCGTRGSLDEVLAAAGVERIAGAHCYEFYAGAATFGALQEEDPATFYLTDFLTRQFDTLIIRGLGLDRHPELMPLYFGNYRRLVYLAQGDDPALLEAARTAADRLGLTFEERKTGFGELATAINGAASHGSPTRRAPGHPGAFAGGQSSADGARPTLPAPSPTQAPL